MSIKSTVQSHPTRRTMLAGSLAAAAAPMFVPQSAFGANEKITMAIIGSGSRGNGVMGGMMRNDACRFVAACDVDRNRMNNTKKKIDNHYKNKDCKTYTDYREVIGRDDIDAVLVATPDHWHGLVAIAAANSGKDIYCEKPITHTFEEGRMLYEAVAKNDRVFQVGSQQRSTFNFRWAVELVWNGHIGKIKHVEVGLPTGHKNPPANQPDAKAPEHLDYNMWCGPSEKLPYHPKRLHWDWRWHLSYGGGQLMDWIGHHNDIAHWGLGEDYGGPAEVKATGFKYPDDRTVWNASYAYEVQCTYPSGVTTSISNKHRRGVKWIGEDGWVFVARGKYEASKPEWTKKDFDRGEKKLPNINNHYNNFLDCVKTRRKPEANAEVGHRSITPGHLGLVSEALGGKTLQWDAKKEVVTNDDQANKLLQFNPRKPYTL